MGWMGWGAMTWDKERMQDGLGVGCLLAVLF
jgi:hypothetical protein